MTQQKEIIGLDLDGVIIDHTENRLALARRFGYNLEPKETSSDVFKTKIPEETRDEIDKFLYDDPVSALTPPTMAGAREGLDFLKKKRVPYYLISRRKTADPAISLLFKRNLWPNYFNETNAFFANTPEEKNQKAKELGISVYVDDQPSVIEKLVDVPAKFLFDNHRVYEESANYKKVHSWGEFLENVKIL